MLNALRLIVKNGSIILFICLQIICFYWIIQYNQKQKDVYLYSSQLYANKINTKVQSVSDYFRLQKQNDSLIKENANILTKYLTVVSKAYYDTSAILSDSFNYKVFSARVVNNSISRRNNMITLDKGKLDGINVGMGVVTGKGLVGIVTDVSDHFSLVMSLLHTRSRISCKLLRSGFFGTLIWNGKNPDHLQLEDIQRYADVQIGDSVVTSGYSIIFPQNLLIGVVKEFHVEPGAFTYSMDITPTQSFYQLDKVYIINHPYKEEKQLLESKADNYE